MDDKLSRFVKFAVTIIVLASLTLLAGFVVKGASSETPHLLPFQGVATDKDGNLVMRGNLTVRVYDALTGGNLVYNSGNTYVNAIENGVFDVLLGSDAPLNLDNTKRYYMEVDINGEEVVGDTVAGGRQEFWPGGGSHTHTHDASDITGGTLVVDGLNVDSGTLYVDNVKDRVGIGTTSPNARLVIDGVIGMGSPTDVTKAGLRITNKGDTESINFDYGGFDSVGTALYINYGCSNDVCIAYGGGNVGIGTASPAYKLDVEGYVQAYGYYTEDIIFQKDNEKLWRMFEDQDGLYLENLKTGNVYRFLLQEVEIGAVSSLKESDRLAESNDSHLKTFGFHVNITAGIAGSTIALGTLFGLTRHSNKNRKEKTDVQQSSLSQWLENQPITERIET